MYRHLSPKVGPKDKQQQFLRLKHTINTATPLLMPQIITRKQNPHPKKEKQSSTSSNPPAATSQTPTPNSSSGHLNAAKRVDPISKPTKNDSIFDDYYEKKPTQQKDKKQQISISGDSYQSQGLGSIKKPHNPPKSNIDKPPTLLSKNIVKTSPNNQQRNGFKSPGNRHQNKNNSQQQKDKNVKRILSFGEKGLMRVGGGRFFDDFEAKKKKGVVPYFSGSPQAHKSNKIHLDTSDIKNKKEVKLNTSNEQKPKESKTSKNVPKFIAHSNIKSSPYFPIKTALDSSNQISGDRCIKKPFFQHYHQQQHQQQHQLPPQIKLKQQEKGGQEDKSLSFNRGEMFLSLKKRQEQHSLLCKELNMLSISIDLKMLTNEGQKIVKFILIKKISESKKTSIFLGYHESSSFLYCLKRTLLDPKKNQLEQSIRQHKIHHLCSHPHLVKSFCTAYDIQHLYLIMQFMDGQTLGHELKNQMLKNMSEQSLAKAKINQSVTTQITRINKTRKIMFQIIGGITYLHQKGFIHRDIKPDNIFISHDTYKLGDFGSTAKIGSLEYVGTLDYAAPEILTQINYDEKVDIWSLGCLAYQLDVGRPPFFHINPQETKRLAVSGEYDRSLITDSQLRGLIQKMLQTNRKQRISARDLLKHDFFQDLQQRSSFWATTH